MPQTEPSLHRATPTPTPIIELHAVAKYFRAPRTFLSRGDPRPVRAVDGLSFVIRPGETYGLVGESGCGKTTTARMVLGLETPTHGRVTFEGRDIAGLRGLDERRYRASVQAVFQDPWSSLNPRLRVGPIILEPLLCHRRISKQQASDALHSALEDVGMHGFQAEYFPHEFSGGQRQRIAIARALILRPRLIVLDEPVSSLDVSIRAQIINLLRDLQRRYGLSYFVISHNLATLRSLSHHIGVMYLGRIVEEAPTTRLFSAPRHPYTRALIAASLPTHPGAEQDESLIQGDVPSPIDPPAGCHYHPRCPLRFGPCDSVPPELRHLEGTHEVACHLYQDHGSTTY